MAWQEVETDVGVKTGRVKYSVALKHGGARVSVPKAVVDELGWKKTTTFRLLVGGGEVDGKLRIEPADKGRIASKAPPTGEGMIIRLGRWPALAPRDVEAVMVDHVVADNGLTITLPAHALMVPPAPKPAAPPSVSGKAYDVSDRFFNDPKPKPIGMQAGVRR